MTDAQGWVLLGLVSVLLSAIGGLVVQQIHLLRDVVDARITGLGDRFDGRFDAVDQRFNAVDQRFNAVDQRLDSLDRDVQALVHDRFRRED